ncbi:Ubiquitin conjugation factor E4 A [Trichoplax sp. H2]|nr:Ubiquitin conjugation factor E4 A [Trichoplax sp. H2]|eukprot:RDD45100.1 Ubiquitin conjugation factor E4 A [Trichoplax sp. H2]
MEEIKNDSNPSQQHQHGCHDPVREETVDNNVMEVAEVDTDEEFASNPFSQLFESLQHAKTAAKRFKNATDLKETTLIGQMKMNLKDSAELLQLDITADELIVNDILQRILLVTADKHFSKRADKISVKIPQTIVLLPLSNELTEDRCCLNFDIVDEALIERLSMADIHPNVITFRPSNKAKDDQSYRVSLALVAEPNPIALIERLSMADIHPNVITFRPSNKAKDDQSYRVSLALVAEPNPIVYLFECHRRARLVLQEQSADNQCSRQAAEKCKAIVATFVGSCLLTPDILSGQDTNKQFDSLLTDRQYSGTPELYEFLKDILISYPDTNDIEQIFKYSVAPIFNIQSIKYEDIHPKLIRLCNFSQHEHLLKFLIESSPWLPKGLNVTGKSFERTLLGSLLCYSSIVPALPLLQGFGFTTLHTLSPDFSNPTMMRPAQVEHITSSLRTQREYVLELIFTIFKTSLKVSVECRGHILDWISLCLFHNKLRSSSASQMHFHELAGDAFFLNLSSILMELCDPFMIISSPKLLKIDPEACIAKSSVTQAHGIFRLNLYNETKLADQTSSENNTIEKDGDFSFITEIFFLTHKTLHLALPTTITVYKNLMERLAKLQNMVSTPEGLANTNLRQEFEAGVSQQLAMKAHVLDPKLLERILNFYNVTAAWALQISNTDGKHYNQIDLNQEMLSTSIEVPKKFAMLPEFIVDSLTQFIIFLGHFAPEILEMQYAKLEPLVIFITGLMGSSKFAKNPHVRAQLADALARLVPSDAHKRMLEQIFLESKQIQDSLALAVLNVYVDIEKTDNSVEFEQKFSYRHNIYNILEYLWTVPAYKEKMIKLSEEVTVGEQGLKDVIFLRFIHLLTNDAVFLLDEALSTLSDIKKLQEELADEELSSQARREKLQQLSFSSRMARSLNILGNQTVNALTLLTQSIVRPFTEIGMVDRIASMLNYFSVRLAGPKRGTFKVKDFSEFHFKPDQLICNIALIYTQLGQSESFCKAITEDERSYTPQLFYQIERVLNKLARLDIVSEFKELHDKVTKFAAEKKEIEEAMPEPPEEFLDPIMNTLMVNPVILPTSGKIMDKATITRHLFSSQSDPFNRLPLQLDDLVPHQELKERIEQWLRDNKIILPDQND